MERSTIYSDFSHEHMVIFQFAMLVYQRVYIYIDDVV